MFIKYDMCILTVMLAIVITLLFAAYLPSGKISRYDNAIAACEHDLPRNQHCKIIAVVDTNHD